MPTVGVFNKEGNKVADMELNESTSARIHVSGAQSSCLDMHLLKFSAELDVQNASAAFVLLIFN